MKYNKQTKKMLYQQDNGDEVTNNVAAIIEDGTCLTVIALNAYHLGLINGKRAERSKRNGRANI